ncbi:MAG: cysteine hydrolase [Butyrivibrio sp.]|nr:cysteine hydrolase [Butyrivibrio sp.]
MRKILVVIDMQKDFVDGALGTKEAQAIVPLVVDKIRSYNIQDVFATRDTHQPGYMNTQEGRNLPVEHCIEGTEGWEINKEVASVLDGAKIINKPTFGSTELVDVLKGIAAKEDIEIEMIGLCTDICVVSNALLLKAAMPEVPISVDAKCCAGVTVQKHEAALETMRSCQIYVR